MRAHERLFDPHPLLFDPRRSTRHRGHLPAPGLLDLVRCPLCGEPLIARMTRRGPSFPCGCNGKTRRHRH
jgi:hypothetical protein